MSIRSRGGPTPRRTTTVEQILMATVSDEERGAQEARREAEAGPAPLPPAPRPALPALSSQWPAGRSTPSAYCTAGFLEAAGFMILLSTPPAAARRGGA